VAFEKDLIERLHKLEFSSSERDKFYEGTYPLFLEFFRDRIAVDAVTESDAKIGVILAYSWMGRGEVKISHLNSFQDAETALTKAKLGKISLNELKCITNFVSGSLVGTSKYLHFLNPKCFAMWDTNVAWASYRHNRYQLNKPEAYLQYLEDLPSLKLPKDLAERTLDRMPKATEMRVKEFALFQLGLKENPRKSSK
jgi:hypothetical protein